MGRFANQYVDGPSSIFQESQFPKERILAPRKLAIFPEHILAELSRESHVPLPVPFAVGTLPASTARRAFLPFVFHQPSFNQIQHLPRRSRPGIAANSSQ